ncbi:MAG: substrate-binding periplasmic protein [Campylobacterota bacterium]
MKKILLILSFVVSTYASEFFIMTEELKPYNYTKNGELKGISTEVVQKVLENLDYEDETISVYPWSRAIKVLDSNKKAVLFSMAYTQKRAQNYKFACPLTKVDVYFFLKKDNKIELKKLEDAKDLTIGVVQDFAVHKYLVKKGFNKFDHSSSTAVMVKKLKENKIDAIAAVPYAIKSLELDTSDLRQSNLKLYSTELCVAFNKDTSDMEVKKWQEQLIKIHKSGKYEAIYKKYLKEE